MIVGATPVEAAASAVSERSRNHEYAFYLSNNMFDIVSDFALFVSEIGAMMSTGVSRRVRAIGERRGIVDGAPLAGIGENTWVNTRSVVGFSRCMGDSFVSESTRSVSEGLPIESRYRLVDWNVVGISIRFGPWAGSRTPVVASRSRPSNAEYLKNEYC